MSILKTSLTGLAIVALLAACNRGEEILEGERFELRAAIDAETGEPLAEADDLESVGAPFSAPSQSANASWTHKAGTPLHSIQHPALGASLTRIWSANIGQGNSRKHRISADPVVADGRVFTLDSRAQVTAVGLNGAVIWSRDITPASDKSDDASGGGLAVAGDRLYVTSGFGNLVALDAATGAEIWVQRLDAAASGAPTVSGDLVYAVGRDSRAWAVEAENGRIKWQLEGAPSPSGVVGGASPAATDRLAIFPLSSGEIVAALRQGGVRVWASSISGQRKGRVYARTSDVTGDPVVKDGVIYAGSPSGRTIAIDAASGERVWTATEGAMGPVWVSGGSVFLISDQNELVRLDGATGERIWGAELPLFVKERERRRKSIFAHYGPILAGGRLIVASDDGQLRSFNPTDGSALGSVDLPGGAASDAVVAGQTLYVVSGNGQLHAFR